MHFSNGVDGLVVESEAGPAYNFNPYNFTLWIQVYQHINGSLNLGAGCCFRISRSKATVWLRQA